MSWGEYIHAADLNGKYGPGIYVSISPINTDDEIYTP